MNSELYNNLNNISNNEFNNILNDKTPIETYLDVTIEKLVKIMIQSDMQKISNRG